MSDAAAVPPPTTGEPQIDAALAAVDLSGAVGQHAEQLSAAIEALHQALRSSSGS